jgi:hypothetical protein
VKKNVLRGRADGYRDLVLAMTATAVEAKDMNYLRGPLCADLSELIGMSHDFGRKVMRRVGPRWRWKSEAWRKYLDMGGDENGASTDEDELADD